MQKELIKVISSTLNMKKKNVKRLANMVENLCEMSSVHKHADTIKKKISGQYYDNDQTRSIVDIISGEYLSEEKREELLK